MTLFRINYAALFDIRNVSSLCVGWSERLNPQNDLQIAYSCRAVELIMKTGIKTALHSIQQGVFRHALSFCFLIVISRGLTPGVVVDYYLLKLCSM